MIALGKMYWQKNIVQCQPSTTLPIYWSIAMNIAAPLKVLLNISLGSIIAIVIHTKGREVDSIF